MRKALAIPVVPWPAAAEVTPKALSICVDHGEAMSAPPPKPMMAIPVAIPGRSGNHLIRVETGEM